MSNGNLDRVLKLWISLWHLVLEEKRHLESVCAVLQQLVFSKTVWPHFKNWPEICKLGKADHLMMLVVATLDVSKAHESETVQRVIASFPECFTDVEVQGPVPWSVLKQDCLKRAIRDYEGRQVPGENQPNRLYMMACRGTLDHFPIPYQEFFVFPDGIDENFQKAGILPLPEDIPSDVLVGTLVEWQGKKWIVVENRAVGTSDDDICIAPAECIDLTL